MSTLLSASSSSSSSLSKSAGDDKPSLCLSPQDKLKGSSIATQRKKIPTPASISMAVSAFAMDIDMDDASGVDLGEDLDLDLVDEDTGDHDMDDAGWVSDDNLRALEFDDRLNQDIDWVTHDDVETALKLEFIPSGDDVQDLVFDPSSFLSPHSGLSFDDSDMSSSFAETLSVDTPPPSFGTTSHDAEKLLMSFDTMNFTIPSPTSSSAKKRANLFGKKEVNNESSQPSAKSGIAVDASRSSGSAKGSMSPSLKSKAGAVADETRKDDARASLSKLSIPSQELCLGVLNITTPTKTGSAVDSQKKIGSYSPEARRLRIQKFHEKRKSRTWKKSIKYDCRKKLADDRPRIKGRFVRVLENTPEVKEEDSCSTTCSSSAGSPAPSSTGSPCAGSPVKATPPASVTPVSAAALLATQLQPVVTSSVPAVSPATPPATVAATAMVQASTTPAVSSQVPTAVSLGAPAVSTS